MTTAVLAMDLQNDILAAYDDARRQPLLDRAARLLEQARARSLPVVYITVSFRPGYPEVSPSNKMFSRIRGEQRLIEGTPGAAIADPVAPREGDVVVNKRRVGAFSTTDLRSVLDARGVDHLVLFGVATSGVVLSTVRWAADRDYKLTVIADACLDRDEEVHRVLTGKVFPVQAEVIDSDAWLG